MIRVAVVDDHVLVAQAVADGLALEDDLAVVGTAADVDAAVALLARQQPDVVLVDLRLGGRSSLDRFPALRAAAPRSKLLVLTAWPTEHTVATALERGGSGLLSKAQSLDELVAGVRRAHAGEVVVSADVVGVLVRTATGREAHAEPDVRDVEVLELLAEARSTGDIARSLRVSEHTVRNRIRACMAKLGTHSRVATVAEAARRGWLPPLEPEPCRGWR